MTKALPREEAYTTPRTDIFALVPSTALDILDVGCSNGELGAALRSAVPGRKVTGIDGDPKFCARAKARLDAVVLADLNRMDWSNTFPKEHFDCLIFADVLEHLNDPWECLASACACLRPGGTVIASVPNIRHVSAFSSIFLRGTFPVRTRGIFDRTHVRWFTLRDAASLITRAGLTIESWDYNLRVTDHGGGVLNKVARKLLSPVQAFYPVREFLAYQVCLRARKPAQPEPVRDAG